jgi:hypothetical protein
MMETLTKMNSVVLAFGTVLGIFTILLIVLHKSD